MFNFTNCIQSDLAASSTVDIIINNIRNPLSTAPSNSLIIETHYNNQGEKVTDTQWHNVVAWGKKAEVIDTYLKKGSEIALQGKLVNRKYEKDGVTKYVTEISLGEMVMLDKKQD